MKLETVKYIFCCILGRCVLTVSHLAISSGPLSFASGKLMVLPVGRGSMVDHLVDSDTTGRNFLPPPNLFLDFFLRSLRCLSCIHFFKSLVPDLDLAVHLKKKFFSPNKT
jgi:hypothetical protein